MRHGIIIPKTLVPPNTLWCIFRLKLVHLFHFHNDMFVIFTVGLPFGCVQWRHNKIQVGRLWGIAPQLFGRGSDRPHGVGACEWIGRPVAEIWPFQIFPNVRLVSRSVDRSSIYTSSYTDLIYSSSLR